MAQQTLYLLVGYPGSGKTTTSQIIHQISGAHHMWADFERRKMFGTPCYSHEENRRLYDYLDKLAGEILGDGKSLIFDTNFNFRRDRDLLRGIATSHGATTQVVWIDTPRAVARARATGQAHSQPTRVLGDMPLKDFERMANNLEAPAADEQPIVLDGTIITVSYVAEKLGLPAPMANA